MHLKVTEVIMHIRIQKNKNYLKKSIKTFIFSSESEIKNLDINV